MRLRLRSTVLRARSWTMLAAAAMPATVTAHSDPADRLAGTLSWSFDPLIIVPLAVAAALYAVGQWRLWRRGGAGAGVSLREALLFWTGWAATVLALLSPLDAFGDHLFSAHMVQHEVLMLVAAPLLVLGKPLPVWLWAIPPGARAPLLRPLRAGSFAAAWALLTRPLSAWIIHAVVLWVWHLPALFQAAVGDTFVHTLQHLAFMLSALLFWWAMFDSRHGLTRSASGAMYIFTTAIHSSALGALLTFSDHAWYPVYAQTAPLWGLDPLQDQQLGGLIMWVPGGVVYFIATLLLFARLLHAPRQAVIGNTELRQSGL